jgi:hypothetical protein
VKHPLDSARFKVVRAQEHLCALAREIRGYLDTDPYVIPIEHNQDFVRVQSAVSTCDPPLSVSVMVGDCLTNLRAALDYVVWQLALRHFDPPLNSKPTDRQWVSFPIATEPKGYAGKINGFAKRQMPTDALRIIQDVQPDKAGYESLGWLNTLVNEDKHRMLLTMVAAVHTSRLWLTDSNGRRIASASGVTSMISSMDFLTDPRTGTAWADHAGVKVDGDVAVYITFRDISMPRVPVDRTLEQIVETVANVIPRFDQFFV